MAAAAAFSLSVGIALPVVAHADSPRHNLKRRQHAVKHEIHRQKAAVDDSSHAAQAAQRRLAGAQAELAGAQRHLTSTRARLAVARTTDVRAADQLAQAQSQLDTAEGQLTQARAAVLSQTRLVAQMVAQSYQGGDPQLMRLTILMGAQSPESAATQLQAVDNSAVQSSEELITLTQRQAQVRAQEMRVSMVRDAVAGRRQAAATKLAQVKAIESQAAAASADVRRLVAARRVASHRATEALARDRHRLKYLQAKDDRIQARILRQAMRRGAQHYNSGPLGMPVNGPITSPYGWRFNPIGHYWGLHDGTDFGASCGMPERAAGNGRVISEYYSDVWGNRLFLDLGTIHGHRITVIYNHISTYVVHTGATVHRGQTVSHVGTTGWSTGCHLHFTVLKDGVAVNPMKWI